MRQYTKQNYDQPPRRKELTERDVEELSQREVDELTERDVDEPVKATKRTKKQSYAPPHRPLIKHIITPLIKHVIRRRSGV